MKTDHQTVAVLRRFCAGGLPLCLVLSGAVLLAAAGCRKEPPPPDVRVSAEEIGVMEQSDLIQGRDGGESAVLWGRSVWLFGDTVINVPDVEEQTWHHNSFSWTQDLDASDGITGFEERLDAAGAPSYFIAPTPEEAEFNAAHRGDGCQDPCGARWAVWPGSPVFDAARDRALIFYGLIYAEPGDFNFRGVGQSLAVWDGFDESPRRPVLSPGAEHPTLLFLEDEPGFGNGAVIIEDELYTFACPQDGLEFHCILAKVPLEGALERAAWRFWNGETWATDYSGAAGLFDGSSIMTVAHDTFLGLWLTVYSEPLSNDVMLRAAPDLTGPWSGELKLFTAKRREGDCCVYDAVWHPEYDEQEGKVLYITHSRPTGEGWFNGEFVMWRVEFE
jgi:hypothetical protein